MREMYLDINVKMVEEVANAFERVEGDIAISTDSDSGFNIGS